MSRKNFASVDFQKNSAVSFTFHVLSSAPSSPVDGQAYVDSTLTSFRVRIAGAWVSLGTGTGTVTNVSVGNLSPLFTSSVANATTTPSVTFTASTAAQNAVLAGPSSGGTGAYSFRALVQADLPSSVPLSYWAAAGADISIGGFKITNLAAPVSGSDAVTKTYADNLFNGVRDYKESCRVASTANVSVTYSATGGTSGRGQITAAPNTLNGVSLAANDRILLKDQSTGAQNGIWVVTTLGTGANGVWDRATDFDADAEVTAGCQIPVTNHSTTDNRGVYILSTSDPIVIGGGSGTALTFTLISPLGGYVAGAGLTLTGLTFDVVSTNTGIAVNANDITLTLASNSGLQISSGLKILPDTTTANTIGLTLTANGAGFLFNTTSFTDSGSETLALAATVAGNGLSLSAGALAVNVDDSTIEINTDALRLKAAGVNQNHIASSALGTTLTGGSGTVLNVAGYTFVSGATVSRKVTSSQSLTTGAFSVGITHNLNTKDVSVSCRDTANDEFVDLEVVATSVNQVTVSGNNNTGGSISAVITVQG